MLKAKGIIAWYFKLRGWKFVNKVPDELRSFVLIGGPHTSNYDFIPSMAVAHLMRRNAKFVIKDSMFWGPLGPILRAMGAIGIDRSQKKASYTDAIAELFKQHEELVVMIAPEGTRQANSHWKTGFYHIAKKAQVPIVVAFMDYKKKEAGLGLVINPADFDQDMRTVMEFLKDKEGHTPINFSLDERFKS